MPPVERLTAPYLWVRRRYLRSINDAACRRHASELPADAMPTYIVVTPHLVHLAPLAAQNRASTVAPVFVANGLGASDVSWLGAMSPGTPILVLNASLRSGSASMLQHGAVIDHLLRTIDRDCCFQDADCFISDSAFWASMVLKPGRHYAAGPFLRETTAERPAYPETFLIRINRALFDSYRRTYGISAEPTARPGRRARELLRGGGYAEGRYLETLKDYYDTLQQYWIAAQLDGFTHNFVSGAGSAVHHVGGTSYLHRSFENLEHWDYWPLNVHYFHLRLLELPQCARFRDRFRALIDLHRSSTDLLAACPEFAGGWRRRESDLILDRTGARSVYGAP